MFLLNSQATMFFAMLDSSLASKTMINYTEKSVKNALSEYPKSVISAIIDKLEDTYETIENKLDSDEYISENTEVEENLVYDEDSHRYQSEPAQMSDEYEELIEYKKNIYKLHTISKDYYEDRFED